MRHLPILLLLASPGSAQQPDPLARAAEEAEVFHQNIARLVGQETLRQRVMKPAPRIRLATPGAQAPLWQQREIVSEYGVATFQEAGGVMHEVRKVVRVDGRAIGRPEQARISLVRGMTSEDDRIQRKLLLDFEKHGLVGTATDFALSLLMFRRVARDELMMEPGPRETIDGRELASYAFKQRAGEGKFSVFEGRELVKQPLKGLLWVRASDGVPVRLVLISEIRKPAGRRGQELVTRDQGTIDYAPSSSFGLLLPVRVRHQRTINGQLVTDNDFTYQRFQRFSAETEIKFSSEDDPAGNVKK